MKILKICPNFISVDNNYRTLFVEELEP
uniref:Uncharacterized protein n=1 Tax=Nelumbo nucifera TaxID=4432 RepID=A0A822Z588_NELNU|nr:TPA_asm: hypothetical protein HUJ06_012947 [Nelumbo nucifera]